MKITKQKIIYHSSEANVLLRQLDEKNDLETFFAQLHRINPNASLIKGTICGYRIEEIDDPLIRNIRYLDKLIDELAQGKKMENILRKAGNV